MSAQTPICAQSREDFAALLEESFRSNEVAEGAVVKGKVVAIEKDVAVIDIGAEDRRPCGPQGIQRPRP